MAFVLASGAALTTGLASPSGPRRAALLLLAGLLAGFGTWFAYSAAAGLVALLLVARTTWCRGGPIALLGLPVGLAPLLWHLQQRPDELLHAQVTWALPTLAPLSALTRWLLGDFLTGSPWPDLQPGLLSGAWWLFLVALATAGCATALRHDLWADNPAGHGLDAFNMRYRVPLIVLMTLAAAVTTGTRGRLALLPTTGVAALSVTGLLMRAGAWTPPAAALDEVVLIPGFHLDASMPEGQPPQRVPHLMGRRQDLIAAGAFLVSHSDPLPICRADHLAELGRRAALAMASDHPDDALDLLAGVAADPGALPHLAAGLVRGAEQGSLSLRALRSILSTPLPDLARAIDDTPR